VVSILVFREWTCPSGEELEIDFSGNKEIWLEEPVVDVACTSIKVQWGVLCLTC
jgi:hypothetical protein